MQYSQQLYWISSVFWNIACHIGGFLTSDTLMGVLGRTFIRERVGTKAPTHALSPAKPCIYHSGGFDHSQVSTPHNRARTPGAIEACRKHGNTVWTGCVRDTPHSGLDRESVLRQENHPRTYVERGGECQWRPALMVVDEASGVMDRAWTWYTQILPDRNLLRVGFGHGTHSWVWRAFRPDHLCIRESNRFACQ